MNTRKKKSRQLSRQYRKYRHKTSRRRKNTRAKRTRTRTRTRGKVKRYIRRRKTTKKGSRKKVSMLDVVKKRLKLMNKVNKQIFKRGTQRGGAEADTENLLDTLKKLAEILGGDRSAAAPPPDKFKADDFIPFINNSYLLYSNMYSCLRFVQKELNRRRWQEGVELSKHTDPGQGTAAPFNAGDWAELSKTVVLLVKHINAYYETEFLVLFEYIQTISWPIFVHDYTVPTGALFKDTPFDEGDDVGTQWPDLTAFEGLVGATPAAEKTWLKTEAEKWEIKNLALEDTFLGADLSATGPNDAEITTAADTAGAGINNLPTAGSETLAHLKKLGLDNMGKWPSVPRSAAAAIERIGMSWPTDAASLQGDDVAQKEAHRVENQYIIDNKIGNVTRVPGWLAGFGMDGKWIFDLNVDPPQGPTNSTDLERGTHSSQRLPQNGPNSVAIHEGKWMDTILYKMPFWIAFTNRENADRATFGTIESHDADVPKFENYSHKLVKVLYHTCFTWNNPDIPGTISAATNKPDKKKYRFERRKMIPNDPDAQVNLVALKGVILYINGIIAYHYMARAIYIELLKLKVELYRAWNTVGHTIQAADILDPLINQATNTGPQDRDTLDKNLVNQDAVIRTPKVLHLDPGNAL